MVDIHCHILPGVDDGAPSMEDSLEMARMAADSGVTDIIATPHCNLPGNGRITAPPPCARPSPGCSRPWTRRASPCAFTRGPRCSALRSCPGCCSQRQLQTLGGSRYLLVEFYFDESAEFMEQCFRDIRHRGLVPVAAHPERYNAVQRDPARLEGWFRRGIVIQLNKGSVLGRLGRRAQDTALWLLEHGLAHAAASDAHRPTVRTTHMGLLRSTLADDFSPDCPRLLLDGNPRRILDEPPHGGGEPAYFFSKGGRAMRAIRKMQRVVIALFILVLLAFCGLRIYRRVTVDTTPPVITCSSDSIDVSVTAGEDALLQGVMASDDRDGDLTDQILIKGVTPALADSSAQVTYIVFDSANNMATVTRTVRYTDYQAPALRCPGPWCIPWARR